MAMPPRLPCTVACAVALALYACGTTGSRSGGGSDAAVADTSTIAPVTEASADAVSEGTGIGVAFDGSCGGPLVWSKVPGSPGGYHIAGSGPSDIWLMGGPAQTVNGPCVPGPDNFYVCGGSIMHGDGVSWTTMIDPAYNPAVAGPESLSLVSLWVGGPNDVFVGGNIIFRWDGSQWTAYSPDDNRTVETLWGTGPNDVWGTRNDGAYLGHWDGITWSHVDSVNGGIIAGGAPGDFWGIGPLFLADDAGSARMGNSYSYNHHIPDDPGCDGADASLGSVSPTGAVCCFDEHGAPCGAFEPSIATPADVCPLVFDPPLANFWPVSAGWASAADDVWFVGVHAFHYDGAGWTCPPIPTASLLQGIAGTSRTDIWAVGMGGVVLHYDGATWSTVPSPTSNDLYGVWESGPCDVWAIGDAVYHAHPAGDASDL